jgi:threonine/homoserine/homoserine lactone efflux protein
VSHLAAFLGVSIVVIVTPGPDTALTVRNTLFGGRVNGLRTALGVATGQAVWTIAASAGVAALVAASHSLFVALRFAGAAYLVWLGAEMLRGRRDLRAGGRVGAGYRQGVLSNLGNPKMVVFFTSLLPQFATGFAHLVLLGLLFCGLTLTWLSLYAVVVARARSVVLRPRVRRALDLVTGTALVAFGARLAVSRD